jgi:hypothetical protein
VCNATKYQGSRHDGEPPRQLSHTFAGQQPLLRLARIELGMLDVVVAEGSP